METLEVIGRLVLAAVFALAGVTKLVDRSGSVQSMAAFGLPPVLAPAAGIVLPIVELICAIALIPATTAQFGAFGVLLLLLLFIVAITVNLARGRTPDCHCFGQLHSAPIDWDTVARNVILAAVAALVIRHGAVDSHRSIISALSELGGANSVAGTLTWVALALAGTALYVAFNLLRQNGRLLIRVEAIEAKLGLQAEAPTSGLPVGSTAPAFEVRDLDGNMVTLEQLQEPDKPLVLIFSEPGCGACDTLMPEVGGWQHESAGQMTMVVVSRGTVGQNRNKRVKHDLKAVVLQRDREVAEAYRIPGSPSAVVIEQGRVALPTAVGTEPVRQLVATLKESRSLIGTPLPPVTLADLRGSEVDLSTLSDRRTLLLFWSPTCGYCQDMLDDVKTWEMRPGGKLDLVVIPSGSAESNHGQGFRSTVLLDERFKAGESLGITGTPSAVIVEHGKVASAIAVGKPAVLALADR